MQETKEITWDDSETIFVLFEYSLAIEEEILKSGWDLQIYRSLHTKK